MNKYTYICEEVSVVLDRDFRKLNKKGKIKFFSFNNRKSSHVSADDIDSLVNSIDDLIKNEENLLLTGFDVTVTGNYSKDFNSLKKYIEMSYKIKMNVCDKISKKINEAEKKGFNTETEKTAIKSLYDSIYSIQEDAKREYNCFNDDLKIFVNEFSNTRIEGKRSNYVTRSDMEWRVSIERDKAVSDYKKEQEEIRKRAEEEMKKKAEEALNKDEDSSYNESVDLNIEKKFNSFKNRINKSNMSFIGSLNKIKVLFKSVCGYIKKVIKDNFKQK